GARRPEDRGEDRPSAEEGGVDGGRRLQVTGQADAARDHVEAGQEEEEGDVLRRRLDEGGGPADEVEDDDGGGDHGGEQGLVAVRLPPARDPERADRDAEKQDREGEDA